MYNDNYTSVESIEFDWDKGNEDKNYLKHNVSQLEAEEAFFKFNIINDDAAHSSKEKRLRLLGSTDGEKVLVVIFTERAGKVRVVSARTASRKERKTYEEVKRNTKL